jgi:hypothetical protein
VRRWTGPALPAVVALVVAVLMTGCGVRAQERPEPLPSATPPATDRGDSDRPAGPRLTVYFVRGADLAPVERRTSATTAVAALDLLVDGPTRAEAGSGIRTALAPEVVGVDEELPDGTTTVSVTRGFTGLTGGNQLLAVAQVVWTLTDLPTVTAVRFTVESAPVEVPTDTGLTDRPVDRDDYRSAAPVEPPPTASSAPETSTGPPEGPARTGSPTPD